MSIDNFTVFQARSRAERISIGNGNQNQVRTNGFQVASLIVDRNIRWSPVSLNSTESTRSDIIADNSPPQNSGSTGQNSGNAETPPSKDVQENIFSKEVYSDDFTITLPQQNTYYMVAQFDGAKWSANANTGFFYENFDSKALPIGWNIASGSWATNNGYLQQSDLNASNSNLYSNFSQTLSQEYLIHTKVRLLETGSNVRFGLHFQASEGRSPNRGSSYLVWFRHSSKDKDLVEVYRANEKGLPLANASFVDLQPNVWYEVKIQYSPLTGIISVYLDNQRVLFWRDTQVPISSGSFLSFRTGNAKVQFDDLIVFRQATGDNIKITVGNTENDMIQFRSIGDQAAARLYTTYLKSDGSWAPIVYDETRIQ